jgi:hypothetical protein
MAVVEQWGVPLVVLGMTLATLFMAGVASRYQTHQAVVRASVRRIEGCVGAITGSLEAVRSVPLSRELRVMLRGNVLVGYQEIRRLYRRYPEIGEKLLAAERALQSEGVAPAGGVGAIDTERGFRQIIGALDLLSGMVRQGELCQPLARELRLVFCTELGERRAEVMARFHLVQARRQENAGNLSKARTHLMTLAQVLRRRGPGTDFVRELYSETEAALSALTDRQIGLIASPAAGDRTPVDALPQGHPG